MDPRLPRHRPLACRPMPRPWPATARQWAQGVLCAAALAAGTARADPPPQPASAPAATHAPTHVAAWAPAPHRWPDHAEPASTPAHAAAHEPDWQRWGLRLAALCIGAGVGWLLLRLGRDDARPGGDGA